MDEQHKDAEEYLKSHKIPTIMQNDPTSFMVQQLQQLKKYKAGKVDTLPLIIFDESNLMTLFKSMDMNQLGFISLHQYAEAMRDIGITEYNRKPSGHELSEIKMKVFVEEA